MATATLEFEKPIVELEKQIDELKRLADERQLNVVEEIAPLEKKLVELREEIYRNLTPLQRVQVARSNKRPFTRRLPAALLHRLHRAARRPRVPRGRGDHRRLGAARRRDGDGDRPPARPRHQGESEAQLRDAASRGLPQGAAPDEARREVPRAGDHLHRHAGRVGGTRRGGARPERGDRAQSVRDEPARDADHRHGHRRGRLGRRARARRRRSHEHAGERGLLGDHRRGLRGDPLEGRQEPGDAREGRDRAAHHRARPVRAARDRRDHPRAGRRRARRSRGDGGRRAARRSLKQLEELRRLKPDKLVRRRREKFLRMGQFLE